MNSGRSYLDLAAAVTAKRPPSPCSAAIPQVGSGASLSAVTTAVTPRVVRAASSLGSALAPAFLRQGKSNQMQGNHFPSPLGLAGQEAV